jgi:hypothetical protein
MVLIAYVALLLGAVVSTKHLGARSRYSFQKALQSADRARLYAMLGRWAGEDARLRRQNVAEFQAGRIPARLLPIQREFLRSLEEDPKVTSDYRNLRRNLILDSEKETLARQEKNAAYFHKLETYHDALQVKHEHLRWHPWLPIKPDPPEPK